jgi:hypothetical protein
MAPGKGAHVYPRGHDRRERRLCQVVLTSLGNKTNARVVPAVLSGLAHRQRWAAKCRKPVEIMWLKIWADVVSTPRDCPSDTADQGMADSGRSRMTWHV